MMIQIYTEFEDFFPKWKIHVPLGYTVLTQTCALDTPFAIFHTKHKSDK